MCALGTIIEAELLLQALLSALCSGCVPTISPTPKQLGLGGLMEEEEPK